MLRWGLLLGIVFPFLRQRHDVDCRDTRGLKRLSHQIKLATSSNVEWALVRHGMLDLNFVYIKLPCKDSLHVCLSGAQ